MPTFFDSVYLNATARHLPNAPIDNDSMDDFIAPLNRLSGRIKQRILNENGIQTRHYAIRPDGTCSETPEQMAACAVRTCLADSGLNVHEIGMLATGSCAGNALLPGFANMLLGELAAPPMQTLTSQGICASGVAAWEAAAATVQLGTHEHALVAAAEMPSRLFKRSRFAGCGYDADFDAHFLRWMLSDGAGALLLSRTPKKRVDGLRIKLRFIHQRAFSGDYPVCMQLGLTAERSRSHLDFDSWQAAEAAGALLLRQDIRLLPHLFDVGIHEYVKLVQQNYLNPEKIQHFLCHYSSEKFAPVVADLMEKAGLAIPRERWFSNLKTRGNTGSASIFIMLDEFLRTRELKAGEQILCFVPESGRFTVSFILLEVEDAQTVVSPNPQIAPPIFRQPESSPAIAAPHDANSAPPLLREVLSELAVVWHDYRSAVWRVPTVVALREGRWQVADYLGWMRDWIPQVREGSKWMREGAAALTSPFEDLAALIQLHASEEQNDYATLFDDYRRAGGQVENIDDLRRNAGGEALNSYMHALAATPNPIGLLGAIYIIEGTGQRIIPALLPIIKGSLKTLPHDVFRFLEYHGENDEDHLARWLMAVEMVLQRDTDGSHARAIVQTAKRTAQLYLMQFEHLQREETA